MYKIKILKQHVYLWHLQVLLTVMGHIMTYVLKVTNHVIMTQIAAVGQHVRALGFLAVAFMINLYI